MRAIPPKGVIIAGSLLVLGTSAMAVRSSLDATPPPLIELGDVTEAVGSAPTLDLFLDLRYSPEVLDTFARAEGSGLGISDTGHRWVDTGDWIVDGEAATLRNGLSQGPSMALVDAGPGEQLVGVEFAQVAGGAGLVYAYLDAQHYWAVVAAPGFALWQIWEVREGEANLVARLGPPVSTDAGVELAVHITSDAVDYYVDGRLLLTLNHPIPPQATGAGMIALRGGSVPARWHRFAVATEND